MTQTQIAPWLADSRWPTVPIRFLARLGTGHTPSRSVPEYWENCSIPWITLADVWQLRDGSTDVITDTKEKISEVGLANSAAVRHPAGTVILSRTASVGFSAIMGADMATSQDFATWTCGSKLHPRYLLHALRAMANDLKRVAAGSTHKTIYMPDIEQLRIPAPPIEEQRRIADFLDAETARIDKLSALQSESATLIHERESALLDGTIDELMAHVGAVPFRRFIAGMDQGASPQCDSIPAGPNEWGVLKVSCLRPGLFLPEENKRLPENLTPDVQREIQNGDLLITRANTPQLVGSTAVVQNVRPKLLLSDKIFRIRLLPSTEPRYIAAVARSTRVRSLCGAASNGASQSMANIRFEEVKEWQIPPIDIREQLRVVAQVNERSEHNRALLAIIDKQAALLAERRQALITAAVTGQIDVSTASGRGV
ncbi:restriction endonuclease subunit S [Micromonospora tulbaghiae]